MFGEILLPLVYIKLRYKNFNLDYDTFIDNIKKYPNIMNVIYELKENDINKFVNIFYKTRYEEFITKEAFDEISLENSKKFDLKIWRKFKELPLFKEDKLLARLINFASLFDKEEESIFKETTKLSRVDIFYEEFSYSNYNFDRHYLEKIYSEEELLDNFDEIIEKTYAFGYIDPLLDRHIYNGITDRQIEIESRGIYGRKIKKHLEIPFTKVGDKYYLNDSHKEDIQEIIGLKFVMTEEEMQEFTTKFDGYLKPYYTEDIKRYRINKDSIYNNEIVDKLINTTSIKTYHLSKKNFDDLFINTVGKEYSKAFSDFVIKYYPDLLRNCELLIQDNKELLFHLYQRCSFYQEEIGMLEITLNNYYGYLDYEPDDEFGFDDTNLFNNFLSITNTPVVDELKKIWKSKEDRKIRSISEINKVFDVEYEGKTYKMTYEVLNRNSRISHLLGDRNISYSCFDIDGIGETSLRHANQDPNGGVLITKVNLNGRDYILSHSWIWKNKNQLCIDSIETTSFYDFLKEKNKKIMKFLLKETIDTFAKDIIEEINEQIDLYCEIKSKKGIIFNYINKNKMKELKDLRLYQKLNIVTVGTKCDHFVIKKMYDEKADVELDRLPNDYFGYSDVEVNNHLVVYKTKDYKVLKVDYKDKPIFRSISGIMTCIYINNTDLKRLADLSIGTKHESKFFKNGKYLIQTIKQFEELYGTNIGSLMIIQNFDWARVFKIDNGELYLVESIVSDRCLEKNNYEVFRNASEIIIATFTKPINLLVEDQALEEVMQKEKTLVYNML